ncbi:MAG: hypothetical protein HKN36_06410 [Hellea sp.]|nr:hypothetical protein [Hellea sp.]
MAKFILGAVATSIAATAFFAASASAITNDRECTSEGGTMVKVKGSDYCLVPIRDEAYQDEIYDGNQLGVTECPGDELNDGLYCMYPVTIRPEVTDASSTTTTDTGTSLADVIVDEAVDAGKDMAKDAVTDVVKDKIK